MKPASYLFVVATVVASFWISTPTAHAEGPMDKLKRGAAGTCLGFIEVPATLCEESRHEGLASGLTLGWFKAAGNFIAREFVGVYELVTFPIPCPNHYKPYMEPPYPWDRFESPKEGSPVPPPPVIPQTPKPAKP